MKELEAIKAQANINAVLGKTASQDDARGTLKLIAALEAVDSELALAERTFSGFADEDLMVTGVCVSVRTAISEALA